MRNGQILILNGAAESGKGTLIKYLKELFNLKIKEYSSIDYVKSVAEVAFGWDGIKDAKGRNLLSDIKQAMIAYNGLPMKKVIEQFLSIGRSLDIMIVDIREPDQIEDLVEYCELNYIQCVTCRVINDKAEAEAEKLNLRLSGDRLYDAYGYDVEIDNNGTLKEFQKEVFRTFKDRY